jgi:hypothetical protein
MQDLFRQAIARASRWGAWLFASWLAASPSAGAPPIAPADPSALIPAAELILTGRAEQVTITYPNGVPAAITEPVPFTIRFTIRPDRVLLGSLPPQPEVLDVHAEDVFGSIDNDDYRLFFLRRAPQGGYTLADPTHLCLLAVPTPPTWSERPVGLNRAIALELIDVIATPRERLTDTDEGMHFSPFADPATEAEMIYEEAVSTLENLPPGAVIDPLRAATAHSKLLNRLWAGAVLFELGDANTLDEIAPALMAPPPYAFRAAAFAGHALDRVTAPNALPSLVSLLKSEMESTRSGAAYALRQIGTPATIRPLAELVLREQNRDVVDQAMWGLCEATHTKSDLCGRDIWSGSLPEVSEARRIWAKTLLTDGQH